MIVLLFKTILALIFFVGLIYSGFFKKKELKEIISSGIGVAIVEIIYKIYEETDKKQTLAEIIRPSLRTLFISLLASVIKFLFENRQHALIGFCEKVLSEIILGIFETFDKLFSQKEKPGRNAQVYIDKAYPPHKRKGVTELPLQNLRLKGPLSLKGFADLTVINCRHNRITSLNLSDCQNLRKLYCDDNQRIKDLDLSNLKKLV